MTVVIAAGLVLAAVIVTRTPAQQQEGIDGACCLGSGDCLFVNPVQCDDVNGTYHGAGVTCQEVACFPALPPTVVAVSVTTSISDQAINFDRRYRLWRTWSDGQVDMTNLLFVSSGGAKGNACVLDQSCGPVVIIPGTCPTDINRDGDTGIQDFLTLLGGWGACQ